MPEFAAAAAPSATRAAAASHGTNGGDVKALLRRGVRALAILQTRQRRQPRCSVPLWLLCGIFVQTLFSTNLKFRYQQIKK